MSYGADKLTPQQRALAQFLSERRVLVIDPNAASRAGLAKALIAFGAKSGQTEILGSFAEGRDRIREKKPEVVISEYTLPGGSGLEIAQMCSAYSEPCNKLFILVTSNSSQSLVAQAAEEDVDLFLLKPYTLKTFNDCITRVVLGKVNPSEYIRTIESGKKLLGASMVGEAIEMFKRAEKLTEKPALALYYRGQAELIQSLVNEAIDSFSLGLKHNEMHYKCMTGLFDVLLSQKRNVDAYDVVKKIAKFFPSNPKRLAQVLTLAIQTGNFDDIDTYYGGFQEIEVRSDELVRHVCAALIICGKQFFRTGMPDKAVDMLSKASITAAGKPQLLREIVTTLAENGKVKEAQAALSRFPSDLRNDPTYHLASFILFKAENPAPDACLGILAKILRTGVRDPMLTYWLIRLLMQLKKVDQAENYKVEADKEWPDKRALFEKAFKNE